MTLKAETEKVIKMEKVGVHNTFKKEAVLFEIVLEDGDILVARAIASFPARSHAEAVAEYNDRIDLESYKAETAVTDNDY